MKNKVDAFLADIQSISTDQFEIITSVRELFLVANSNLTEGIKYGGLVFSLSNTLVGGIFPYKGHISIEFSAGAHFTDPRSKLEGKGKMRRHLKIYSNPDIVNKDCLYFIKQAVN